MVVLLLFATIIFETSLLGGFPRCIAMWPLSLPYHHLLGKVLSQDLPTDRIMTPGLIFMLRGSGGSDKVPFLI